MTLEIKKRKVKLYKYTEAGYCYKDLKITLEKEEIMPKLAEVQKKNKDQSRNKRESRKQNVLTKLKASSLKT